MFYTLSTGHQCPSLTIIWSCNHIPFCAIDHFEIITAIGHTHLKNHTYKHTHTSTEKCTHNKVFCELKYYWAGRFLILILEHTSSHMKIQNEDNYRDVNKNTETRFNMQ